MEIHQKSFKKLFKNAIKLSFGKYIVRVDSDDWVHEEFLNIMSTFLALNKKIDAVACDYTMTDHMENLFNVLVLGLRDYAKKCGFKSTIFGLSGGIDSALVAIIATAALSANNVNAVLMPSPWSSTGSIEDALNLVKKLGINSHIIPIENLMKTFDFALEKPLEKSAAIFLKAFHRTW